MPIQYKRFCWSLGTTSFRTKDFNRTIELQLSLLDDFWKVSRKPLVKWEGNSALQEEYYDFMKERGFLSGEAGNKSKDAREKTSGLADIGLIDGERNLTNAGRTILEISQSGDFSSDNFFEIPKDSYIYLKQLLKTYDCIEEFYVRPFVVMLYVLSKTDFLTLEEYTYLLPLCTTTYETEKIIQQIFLLRNGKITVDDIIISRLMSMDNYKETMTYWLKNSVSESVVCEIGLNRKSRAYDKDYFRLFNALKSVFVDKDIQKVYELYLSTYKIKIGVYWRKYLFNISNSSQIKKSPKSCMNKTSFNDCSSVENLKKIFFEIMHLFKAKATLSDYFDLNRRYMKTTDIVIFEDETVRLDIIPKHFFKSKSECLKSIAYTKTNNLYENCDISEISPLLEIKEQEIIDSVSSEIGINVSNVSEANILIDENRYKRLMRLIDSKFTDDKLITLLSDFEERNDDEIRNMVTDNADIPTIFEYVVGILWYKISGFKGKILDYLKLSLDSDLLPKTHATGGEADIVYEYEKTPFYPKHSLLLEVTLTDSSNQRRMEMESVSRHLGNHLLKTMNMKSYCVFATNDLNINVISDFRARKEIIFYDSVDYSKHITGMKIIPIQTHDLKEIIKTHKTYEQLYELFDSAYKQDVIPHLWYKQYIKEMLER